MIHKAGVLVDQIQRCIRCGYVLSDYRNAMIPVGDPPLVGFAVGAAVEVFEGNPRHCVVVEDRPNCGGRRQV